ncbi:MAG: hypothetical protein ACI92G_001293 [Candidatus Pelagisphaera sp.]|jgi:hypothetical protein
MNSKKSLLSEPVHRSLFDGVVIPALPLALTRERRFDERRQRALLRYYMDAGSGGVAVGVHSTQFEIRDPNIGLYEPVLSLAAEEMKAYETNVGRPLIKVAGVVGQTNQAVKEAELAASLGYDIALVSLSAFKEGTNDQMIEHLNAVSDVMPIFGFYLQPSVGGRRLDYGFWRAAVEIENLVAIKTAPFNRYDTLDVLRAVTDGDRQDSLAMYTGNDDNILLDLLTPVRFSENENAPEIRFRGGLLGQWAVWTRQAVKDLEAIKEARTTGGEIPFSLLTRAQQLTDANAAIFDAANSFAGCIPGIHEILRRQGLLEGLWTLNPNEVLSPGQSEALDRVYEAYPSLNDDTFVKENLDRWLR